MKICYIAEHYPPHLGGVETVFAEYAQRMKNEGHKVRVLTSTSGGTQGLTNESGVSAYHYPWPTFFTHPIPWRYQLDTHVQWCDVVHTTTYTAAPRALASARRFHKPCVVTVHEALGKRWYLIEPRRWKAHLFQLFERYSITRPYSMWHAVSRATEHDLRQLGVPAQKIRMIYHGIDRKRWHPAVPPADLHHLLGLDKSQKIFLFSGRPGPTKGIFLLAEAIYKIKNQISAEYIFGFLIASEPAREYKKFLSLVEHFGIQDRVAIQQVVDSNRLPNYRKAAFVGIVPSLTEGFGFTAAELAALDVPLLVSDAGSLPEVVGGKVLFFRAGNATDLADKIMQATRKEFTHQSLPRFSWDKTMNQLKDLYEEVITSRRTQ